MLAHRNMQRHPSTMSRLVLPLIFGVLLISKPLPSQAQDESLAGSFLSGTILTKITNLIKNYFLRLMQIY